MRNKDQAKNAKIIFGIFLLFMGLSSVLGGNQIQKIKNAYASLSWPSTKGKIISSIITSKTGGTHSGGNFHFSTSYFADVTYEYTVGTKNYSSKKVSYGDYGSSDRDRVETIANRYPKSSIVMVYYNPNAPEDSVLEPGAPISTFVPVGIGILFIVSGFILLYTAILKNIK